jgi:hypothetical protein
LNQTTTATQPGLEAAQTDLHELYTRRRDAFRAEESRMDAIYGRISLLRFLAFVAGLVAVVSLVDVSLPLAGAVLSGAVAAFALLVVRHERTLQRREHHRRLRLVNERELARLEGRLEGLESGAAYQQPEHAYAGDLDLFGPMSLFQMLCRAHTELGRERLAAWLTEPAEVPEVHARQAAVRELAGMLEWRQGFEAHSLRAAESGRSPRPLLEWAAEPRAFLHRRGLGVLVRILPLVTVGLILLTPLGVPGFVPLVLVLVQIGVNQLNERTTSAIAASTGRQAQLLGAYAELLGDIEEQALHAERLASLRGQLFVDGQKASAAVRELRALVHHLDLRHGMLHFPVNSLLMWDLRGAYALERWKRRFGPHIASWLETAGELEALASLAAALFNHVDWTMPQVAEGAPRLRAVGLAHPLLPHDRAVRNDFELASGQIALVTGSNMAGKSTFLRAAGANAVLALAGGPVAAERFELTRVRLYTSMRTQDSLGQSVSLFYAELRRLKQTIDAVAAGEPVLFLLDEILKGTNSADRHRGSEALIRQLLRQKATGLVATHDLELGHLEAETQGAVQNFSFESHVRDGRLEFDYRLRRGPCHSFNAVELMRSMGIDV